MRNTGYFLLKQVLQTALPYAFVIKGSFSMHGLQVLKLDYRRILMLLDELKEDLQPWSMKRHVAQRYRTSVVCCYATCTS